MSLGEEIQKRVLVELRSDSARVLEAGGGKRTRLHVPGSKVTVIDTDEAGLELNSAADERIIGDLETYEYGDRVFDLVVCWDVLEHLKKPSLALRKLIEILSPGGLILVKGPVSTSMKALATRMSPHALHVAFYRHILGARRAGQGGYAPFKTEFSSGAADTDIADLLRSNRMEIVAWERFRSAHVSALHSKAPILYAIYAAAAATTRIFTANKYGGLETDFWLLARKPATPDSTIMER